MTKKMIIEKEGKESYAREIEVFTNPRQLSSITNELGWRIMSLLNKKPMYASELAKSLRINEQNVYYHIRKLKKNGFIEIIEEKEKHGALCKYFAPTSKAFGIELPSERKKIKLGKKDLDYVLNDFFHEFVGTGELKGTIVVGAPTTHGPYLTSARDGHYAIQLSMLLGNLCSIKDKFIVSLDTDVRSEKKEKQNMLVVGGPVTNMICSEINAKLNIKFVWAKTWGLVSNKKRYTQPGIGLIAKIKNPWDKNKTVILLAGLDVLGTKACILGITKFYSKVLKDYNRNKDFYVIVRGLDKDGDGKIDDIGIIK